jgi:hypothetical protein
MGLLIAPLIAETAFAFVLHFLSFQEPPPLWMKLLTGAVNLASFTLGLFGVWRLPLARWIRIIILPLYAVFAVVVTFIYGAFLYEWLNG